jgi:hypothetical protein
VSEPVTSQHKAVPGQPFHRIRAVTIRHIRTALIRWTPLKMLPGGAAFRQPVIYDHESGERIGPPAAEQGI